VNNVTVFLLKRGCENIAMAYIIYEQSLLKRRDNLFKKIIKIKI